MSAAAGPSATMVKLPPALKAGMVPLPDFPQFQTRLAAVYRQRCGTAIQNGFDTMAAANHAVFESAHPVAPLALAQDVWSYWTDAAQRSVLFWETLHRRGNNWIEHEKAGKPPLLAFEFVTVADGRDLARPVNYSLVQIIAPAGVATDPEKRPFVLIDPRAGHGPGIGGFKQDSQVGIALHAGHPVYALVFAPEPVEGQTLADVSRAESAFLHMVRQRHATRGMPVVIGNCQGGWAAMLVGALDPESVGPLVINGAPMSYWAGNDAENPMRYAGGILGGAWTALLTSDLGGGLFDGAYLVDNFEYLNPTNTYFTKYYNLYSRIDTEPERFLEFERWWGGYFLMNRAEIKWIVENLFVGNRLAAGKAEWDAGKTYDLRDIRSPIIVFASLGDNITPPQQAFDWVADLYPTTEALKANGQVIIGLVHQSVGHLGIFVSGAVARREHSQIIDLLDYVESLPPGLYGMKVVDTGSAEGPRYDVELTERRVEDLRMLQKYGRRDEIPFNAVARVSEWNVALYESLVHPILAAAVPRQSAPLLRQFHPLRVHRWALSDLNPLMAPLPRIADTVKAARTPRNEAGPSVAAEHWMAAAITASFDLYRQMRDAAVENLFYTLYGTMSFIAPEQQAASPVGTAANDAELPPLDIGMQDGGFTEAAVRAALLSMRLNSGQRRLSTMKLVREIAGREVGLLALPVEDARTVVRGQSYLVEHDPEAARQTLPSLLGSGEERQRFVDLLGRLASRIELNPAQRELVADLQRAVADPKAAADVTPVQPTGRKRRMPL